MKLVLSLLNKLYSVLHLLSSEMAMYSSFGRLIAPLRSLSSRLIELHPRLGGTFPSLNGITGNERGDDTLQRGGKWKITETATENVVKDLRRPPRGRQISFDHKVHPRPETRQ